MKKASLSLSMNAIVILILAITLLGLGLSFMRGLFKQMEEKVTVAVSAQELINPPTTDNPLTLAPSKINIREGASGEVIIAFMNTLSEDADCQLDFCEPAEGDCVIDGLCNIVVDDCTLATVYNNNIYGINQDQINSYTLAISASQGEAGTYLYTASMCCDTDGLIIGASFECDDAGDGMFTKDLVVIVKP